MVDKLITYDVVEEYLATLKLQPAAIGALKGYRDAHKTFMDKTTADNSVACESALHVAQGMEDSGLIGSNVLTTLHFLLNHVGEITEPGF